MSRQFHSVHSVDDVDTTSAFLDPTDQPSFMNGFIHTDAVSQSLVTSTNTVSLAGSGLIFQNTFLSGVTPAFMAAVTAAEHFFQAHFTNSVTLNCSFDLQSLSPSFAGSNTYDPVNVSYAALKAALELHATTTVGRAAAASLPTVDPSAGRGFAVAVGEARILGLAGAGSGIDDAITLNSSLPWAYGQDAIGVLEHELSEGAMGRFGGLGIQNSLWGPMDLFRYSSAGHRDYTGGADRLPAYFSADGKTLALQFHSSIGFGGGFDGFDFADWDHTHVDAFGPGGPSGPGTMSSTDLQVMNVLGWTSAEVLPLPRLPVVLMHDTTTNMDVPDTLSNLYRGPVAGLQTEFIDVTTHSVNIAAIAPNLFVHTGSGNDAVALLSGTNVVDGGTGSNFLSGGTGTDTFFVDARGAVQDTWSTITKFHSGDAVTLWGVSPGTNLLRWSDGGGAVGYTGLTLHASAAGRSTASITLVGFSQADIASGTLTTSFGHNGGGDYLYIHAA
jgi:hypothetical protein